MAETENVIKGLENLSEWLFQQYRVVYDGDAPNYYDAYKTVDDALSLLKEQEEEIENLKQTAQNMMEGIYLLKEQEAEAKWIYGEDKTGIDGWHCSECDFFEPWFYEFTDDIDFIRFYGHCPKCGRRMTSYTGKPTQERR